MPDTRDHRQPAPDDWPRAFAALPPETPPPGGWDAIARRLDARRHARSRAPLWLAAAAVLLLAIALPWRLQWFESGEPVAVVHESEAEATRDPFDALYAESAQLETLLVAARDDRMASGTAALLAGELELRLAAIDAALMQPDLSREQRLGLWQERVEGLRTLAGFESSRRWRAAQGLQYRSALARID